RAAAARGDPAPARGPRGAAPPERGPDAPAERRADELAAARARPRLRPLALRPEPPPARARDALGPRRVEDDPGSDGSRDRRARRGVAGPRRLRRAPVHVRRGHRPLLARPRAGLG